MFIAPSESSSLSIAPTATDTSGQTTNTGTFSPITPPPAPDTGGINPYAPGQAPTYVPNGSTTPAPTTNPGGSPTGTATPSSTPPATRVLGDALNAIAGIFAAFGSTSQPQQPRSVAVPVQNVGTDSNGGGSNILMWVVLAAVVFAGWYGYKHGWFTKAKKVATGE